MKRLFKQFANKQLRYSFLFKKRLRAVQALKQLDQTELIALQEEKLLLLIHRAYHKSPFYHSLYTRHRVDISQIKSVHDLHRCPIITKQDIIDNRQDIIIGSPLTSIKAKSSGTSGQSVSVYRDYLSVIEEGAYQWAHRIEFGHYPGMKTVVIRGNLNMQEKEQYDPFTKTLYLSSFRLNRENSDWYYKRIRDFAPNAIFAYPSSVESLTNFFLEQNHSLQVPLVFTSSETLYSYQREKIEQVFGCRIADWYGNAERTIALEERQDGLYDQLPLYSFNEFRENCVITTSLINSSFPLIRYKVDDVILLNDNYDSSGLKRIDEIQGRSDDVLLLPNGTRVGLICNAFDGIDYILLSQVVQESPYSIHVNLVVSPEYSTVQEEQLIRQMKENIGHQAPFTINYVSEDEIITSESGKFKLIVNNIPMNRYYSSVR